MNEKPIEIGDVVLLYVNTFPQAFLHVVGMKPDPDCVSGIGYWITLMRLEIPMITFTWQLNEDHFKHGFTMNGVPMTLQVVSRVEKSKVSAPPSAEVNKHEMVVDMVRNIASQPNELF